MLSTVDSKVLLQGDMTQFYSFFCENCICHTLKTNKIKYTKVYIVRKGISRVLSKS